MSKSRLMEEPAAYGKFGLANLLELREECLREFQFVDAYISIKQRLASSLYVLMHKDMLLFIYCSDFFLHEGKMKLHWLFYQIF